MTRDRIDKRRPERTLVSFAASLILHAIGAFFLFSLATSSSEQAAPESFTSGAIVTVTREAPQPPAPVRVAHVQVPVPHATVMPRSRVASRPQSAAPHPRVLHELAKFAPTAPPNPTPAPVSSAQLIPAPSAPPQIAVSAAPIPAAAPTSVPLVTTAVSMKTPPTAAPTPKPTAVPTAAPTKPPATAAPKAPAVTPALTPAPEPSVLRATSAPVIALTKPQAIVTPGAQTQIHIIASQTTGLAPTPGPKSPGSPGPKPVTAVKGPAVARPIQASPATPRPASGLTKRGLSLSQRLRSLIPAGQPSSTPAPAKHYHFNGDLAVTPPPPPTPPPEVVAATKYLYHENVGGQRWKQSYLGTAPEELAVLMYVTSVKRIGPIQWCTGWVARMPVPGSRAGYQVDSDRDLTPKWIVEPNSSFICAGHLEPFTPSTPEPPKGS